MAPPDLMVYPDQLARIMTTNGLRIREDVLFTDGKGQENERSRRKAEKILEQWKDILPAILEKDETVFFVVKYCQAPVGAFEQMTMGWQGRGALGVSLVLTNLRLLHLGLEGSQKWRRVLKSLRWGNVAEAKVKGWLVRVLDLKYLNGKKDRYTRVPVSGARKIKDILATVIPASRAEMSSAQGIQSLCPNCRTALTPGIYQCAQCGQKFKTEKILLKRTLLFPGGGYLYSGMTTAGIFSLVVGGILLLSDIWYLAMALHFLPPERANGAVMTAEESWTAVAVVLGLMAFHKWIEYRHAVRMIHAFLPEQNT